jgi:preprotein translocase subunit SecB
MRTQNRRGAIMAQTANGGGQQNPGPEAGSPGTQQLLVNAQYVKDLSFENPRAPQSLSQPASAPAVEINVDVKAQNIGGDAYEVVLTVNAGAKIDGETLFLVELAYGAVVTARNLPPEMLPQALLVEVPRLMFPFARNIVADATRDGGFPPLMINPIDFTELLRRNQAAPPGAPAPGSP